MLTVMRTILSSTRYIVLIPILGALISALMMMVYGLATTIQLFVDILRERSITVKSAKILSVDAIELIDAFLLGTMLYIIAMGLYELFIDESLPTPAWLRIKNFEELKMMLVSVTIVLLGVTFLGDVVENDGNTETLVLHEGIAIAAVVLALVGFLIAMGLKSRSEKKELSEEA